MARIFWPEAPSDAQMLMMWAGSLIPHVGIDGGFDGPARVAAVLSDSGKLIAAVIFHDWQESAGTMQVSCASISPHWASHNVISGLLDYAFNTNKARKLWMAIPHTSENVVKFNKHLGFKQEAVLRYHFSKNQHAVILSMLDHEYRNGRWFDKEVKHG